jgi:hypothetical protein
MIKSKVILLATAFVTLLAGSAAMSQKGPESTNGAPLKGVDVKLGKNPGGSPAARTTDNDGKIHFGVLDRGSYYLIVTVPDKEANSAADDDIYLVKITASSGAPVEWAWRVKKHDAAMAAIQNMKGRSAQLSFHDRITFDSDGVTPTEITIVKSKSNISNNRADQ